MSPVTSFICLMLSAAQQQMSEISLSQLWRKEAEVQHTACQGWTEKHRPN